MKTPSAPRISSHRDQSRRVMAVVTALTAAALSGQFNQANAATLTWTGLGADTSWNTTANWLSGTAPKTSDSIVFNSALVSGTVGGTTDPVLVSGTKILSITFDTANCGAYVLSATTGGVLNVSTLGTISMTSSVANTETVAASMLMNNTNGNYSFINNAVSASAVLKFTGTYTGNGTGILTIGGSNSGSNLISGAITDGTATTGYGLLKKDSGTWVLSGSNTYTGSTVVGGGTLILDFTYGTKNNIINSGGALSFGIAGSITGSSTLEIVGAASTSNTQTLGNITFAGSTTSPAGSANHIVVVAGTNGTVTLTLGNLGTTAPTRGQTLDLSLTGGATATTTSTSTSVSAGKSGLFTCSPVTINGSDFATNNGVSGGALVGLSTISGAYLTATSYSTGTTRALDVQGNTAITSSLSLDAVRFNQAASNTLTIASGKLFTVYYGGILVTSTVGAHNTVITGGTICGNSGRDLYLLQNNTSGVLEIDSSIVNNGAGSGLTKSGLGLALLAGTNTYTYGTYVNEGTLQFAKEVSLYNNGSAAAWTTANLINVAPGATLAFNVGGSGEFTASDIATIAALGTGTSGFQNGSTLGLDTTNAAGGNFAYGSVLANTNSGGNVISLSKMGSNTLTLTGANTYGGSTTVQQGILAFNSVATGTAAQALGSGNTVNLGVAATSSGTLQYMGAAGIFDKNIYALGNGLNTIWNNGSGLLTLPGALVKNGTILVLNGGAGGLLISGTISGSYANSDLYVTGGTTTLTAVNTYNGPTWVYGGGTLVNGNASGALPTATTLILGGTDNSDGAFDLGGYGQTVAGLSSRGTGTTLVTNNGTGAATLTVTSGGTYSGVIADGASATALTVAGGNLILNGTNSYTGPTAITGGTLSVNGALGNSAVTVSSAATLGGSGSIAGDVTVNSGTINGSGLSVGTATLNGGSTLNGINTAHSVTVATGTTSLTGTTSATSGLIVSAGATLSNGGIVDANATVSGLLKGSGTINGNLSLSGTLAPGIGGVGTATINGNLTMASSAVLAMEINGSSHTEVKVSGNVTLAGTLDLSNLSGLTLGETVTLIENTGDATTTSGYFTEILTSGSTYLISSASSTYLILISGTQYEVNYAANVDGGSIANDVTLTVVPEPSTWACLASALGVLIGIQKYRGRKILA